MASRNLQRGAASEGGGYGHTCGRWRWRSPVARKDVARQGEEQQEDGEVQFELLVLIFVGESVSVQRTRFVINQGCLISDCFLVERCSAARGLDLLGLLAEKSHVHISKNQTEVQSVKSTFVWRCCPDFISHKMLNVPRRLLFNAWMCFSPVFLGKKSFHFEESIWSRLHFLFDLIQSPLVFFWWTCAASGWWQKLVNSAWCVCVQSGGSPYSPLCSYMSVCITPFLYIHYINMKTYFFSRWDTSFSLLRWLEMEEEHLSWSLEISSSFCRYSLCVSWTRTTRVTSATTWGGSPLVNVVGTRT